MKQCWAMFAMGAWLCGTLMTSVLATENFYTVDRLLTGSRGQRHQEKMLTLTNDAWQRYPHQAICILRKVIIPSPNYMARNADPNVGGVVAVSRSGEVSRNSEN